MMFAVFGMEDVLMFVMEHLRWLNGKTSNTKQLMLLQGAIYTTMKLKGFSLIKAKQKNIVSHTMRMKTIITET